MGLAGTAAEHPGAALCSRCRQRAGLAAAVQKAGQSLRDLRIAEIGQLDIQIKDGKVDSYRAKVKVSFKYEGGS